MKRNYARFIIAWCLGLGGWSVAAENEPTATLSDGAETPPPPAIESSYFTDSGHSKSTLGNSQANVVKPESSENSSLPVVPSPVVAPTETVTNDSSAKSLSTGSAAPAPVTSAVAPSIPPIDTALAGSAVPVAIVSQSTDNTSSPSSHDDSDASTGIHGAHITSGINFEAPEDDVFSMGGVDTTQAKHASGNWVEKKHYWHEIEEIVDQVKEKIADIASKRSAFFATRSEVDKELSTFYQHVGLDQGPLQDMIHYSLEIMEKEKEQQGFLNRKERAFYEKSQSKQRIFEQLKEDVKAIGVIDTKIDEALDVVLKQINSCNEYEGEVWNIYKTVAYELSEKEAEQHYLVAKAFLTDIENIQMYLSGPFQTYFQELAESVQTHTQNIVMQLDALEKEGLSLKQEAAIFEAEDEQQANEEKAHKEAVKQLDEKNRTEKHSVGNEDKKGEKVAAKKEIQKFSLIHYVTDFFTAIKNSIVSVVTTVKNLFGGTKSKNQPLVAKKTVPTAPVVAHQSAQNNDMSDVLMQEKKNNIGVSEKTDATSSALEVKQPVAPVTTEKKVSSVSKPSDLKETLRYDENSFEQEMEELKKSIEAGAHEVINAPGDLLHTFEKKI